MRIVVVAVVSILLIVFFLYTTQVTIGCLVEFNRKNEGTILLTPGVSQNSRLSTGEGP